VRGEAALFRMPADHLLIGSVVDAVDLVAGDVTLHPLDLRSQIVQDAAGLLRNALELGRRELAGAGNLAFDHELWHAPVLSTSSVWSILVGRAHEPSTARKRARNPSGSAGLSSRLYPAGAG